MRRVVGKGSPPAAALHPPKPLAAAGSAPSPLVSAPGPDPAPIFSPEGMEKVPRMPLLSSSHRLASPCRPHHGSPPGAHRSGGAGHPVGLSSPRPGSGCGPAGRLAGSRARNPRAGASETSPASSFSPFWALQKLLALPEALHGNRSSRPASPNGARGASPEGLRGPQGGSAGSRRGPLRHGDPQPISGTPALGAAAPPQPRPLGARQEEAFPFRGLARRLLTPHLRPSEHAATSPRCP